VFGQPRENIDTVKPSGGQNNTEIRKKVSNLGGKFFWMEVRGLKPSLLGRNEKVLSVVKEILPTNLG